MYIKQALFVLLAAWCVTSQRPFFAGTKPIGFPDVTTDDKLGNRFGDDAVLPVEANGDRDLVNRLSKLPVDKQPFWFINWKALEELRKNPQTYQQKPNVFSETGIQSLGNQPSANNVNTASNSATGLTSKFGNDNSAPTLTNGQTQNNYKPYTNSRSFY